MRIIMVNVHVRRLTTEDWEGSEVGIICKELKFPSEDGTER